jgi:thiol-disulfide isomerase/thioredoxin
MQVLSMTAIVLGARVVLAAVFALAGATKLTDRAGTEKAAVRFGAPRRAAAPLALALPVAELVVAGLLLPASTAAAGAAGAVALLALFSGVMASALAFGDVADCHCFGSLHSASVSGRTLARNAGLAAVAAFALAGSLAASPVSAVAWVARLDAPVLVALVVGAVAVAILVGATLVLLSLLKSYGNVLVRLERLERTVAGLSAARPGHDHPDAIAGLELDALDGSVVSLDEFRGRETVLVFWNPTCGFCRAMHQDLLGWERAANGRGPRLVVVSTGSEAMTRAEGFGSTVLLDPNFALGRSVGARGTPSAIRLGPDGRVASDVVVGSAAIFALGERDAMPADPHAADTFAAAS